MGLMANYFIEDDNDFTNFKNTPQLKIWAKKVNLCKYNRGMIYSMIFYQLNVFTR